jgi:hypothetical protein
MPFLYLGFLAKFTAERLDPAPVNGAMRGSLDGELQGNFV